MNLATIDDILALEHRLGILIKDTISGNNVNASKPHKTWVKKKEALELLSCSPNKLDEFAIHGKIKREKKMGAWYYCVKSIREYLDSSEN